MSQRRLLALIARVLNPEALSFYGMTLISWGGGMVYKPAGVILFGMTLVVTAIALGRP